MRLLRIFSSNAPGVAWKSKPSWYIVANNDRTVHPELQRFVAKRMGASTHAIDSSHVPMLSHPGFLLDVIRKAAQSLEKLESRHCRRSPGSPKARKPRSFRTRLFALAFTVRSMMPDRIVVEGGSSNPLERKVGWSPGHPLDPR
jgi:hypothetical protein